MQETDINAFKGRSVRTLSAGERARVLLARAIAVQAPYLLADEPTAALDPRHQLTVMTLLHRHTRQGVGTLVVVHDLALAAQFCDRVCLLHGGRIMAAGAPNEVLNDDNIATAYGVETVRILVGETSLIVPVGVKVS
jgi:iron complex transport system ATP-binding protein